MCLYFACTEKELICSDVLLSTSLYTYREYRGKASAKFAAESTIMSAEWNKPYSLPIFRKLLPLLTFHSLPFPLVCLLSPQTTNLEQIMSDKKNATSPKEVPILMGWNHSTTTAVMGDSQSPSKDGSEKTSAFCLNLPKPSMEIVTEGKLYQLDK